MEPILTWQQAFGDLGASKIAAIQKAKQMVFHSVGDTGSVVGPATQSLVADKMVSDFIEANSADIPSFFFHLGDLVYYFGESTYYYDQFYEPYRDYPVPILAVPGNLTTASSTRAIQNLRSPRSYATSALPAQRFRPTPVACLARP